MSYPFDLTAAINKIAEIEDAISGIVTSYTYGANPASFTAGSQLPAIVHIPLGPIVQPNAEISHGTYIIAYEILSRLLIVESVMGYYPGDDSGAATYWKSIMDAMLTHNTRVQLCNASGALTYGCVFNERSYGVRPWPPDDAAPNKFWSLEYTHRFGIVGG